MANEISSVPEDQAAAATPDPAKTRWRLEETKEMLSCRMDLLFEYAKKRSWKHSKATGAASCDPRVISKNLSMTEAMWDEVARRIRKTFGAFNKTGKQCMVKFNNLITAYRQRKDGERLSGEGGPFEEGKITRSMSEDLYQLMDEQFGHSASTCPPETVQLGDGPVRFVEEGDRARAG